MKMHMVAALAIIVPATAQVPGVGDVTSVLAFADHDPNHVMEHFKHDSQKNTCAVWPGVADVKHKADRALHSQTCGYKARTTTDYLQIDGCDHTLYRALRDQRVLHNGLSLNLISKALNTVGYGMVLGSGRRQGRSVHGWFCFLSFADDPRNHAFVFFRAQKKGASRLYEISDHLSRHQQVSGIGQKAVIGVFISFVVVSGWLAARKMYPNGCGQGKDSKSGTSKMEVGTDMLEGGQFLE